MLDRTGNAGNSEQVSALILRELSIELLLKSRLLKHHVETLRDNISAEIASLQQRAQADAMNDND